MRKSLSNWHAFIEFDASISLSQILLLDYSLSIEMMRAVHVCVRHFIILINLTIIFRMYMRGWEKSIYLSIFIMCKMMSLLCISAITKWILIPEGVILMLLHSLMHKFAEHKINSSTHSLSITLTRVCIKYDTAVTQFFLR